jgi:hypothetical protein
VLKISISKHKTCLLEEEVLIYGKLLSNQAFGYAVNAIG